jgi:hypothetical protein
MNEFTLNIYNTIITKIADSFDWITFFMGVIAIIIAYYALIYNRPRIEMTSNKYNYDLKKILSSVKIDIHNVGTTSAYNIKIRHSYDDENIKKMFYYPEEYEKYEKIKELLKLLDNVGKKALLKGTDSNNHIVYNNEERSQIEMINNQIKEIFPDAEDREPLTLTVKGLDYKIRIIDQYIEEINRRSRIVKNFFELEINTLIPNSTKTSHFTDYTFHESHYGQFKSEDLEMVVLYDDIKKMDIVGIILFSIIGILISVFKKVYKSIINLMFKNKIKIVFPKIYKIIMPSSKIFNNKKLRKMSNTFKISYDYKIITFLLLTIKRFFLIEFNLEKMEIIIKRQEVKRVSFNEKIFKEDFYLQRELNHNKYVEILYKEFNEFLNSYLFQNWLNTLNKDEQKIISEILINTNQYMNAFIDGYKVYKNKTHRNKTLQDKNNVFLDKYINLIKIMNKLPDHSPLISLDMKEELGRIVFYDEIEKSMKRK